MEQNCWNGKESHAEYLLRQQIEACEVHLDNFEMCACFDTALDSFGKWLDDRRGSSRVEG